MNIRPIVKYHGGKGRLFKWILENMQPHQTYCEPFGGAASVLMNKEKSDVEIYNEIDNKMVNLLTVVKEQKEELLEKLRQISYDKETYLRYKEKYFSEKSQSPIEAAVTTYVAKRMSRGGLCGTFSWSSRIYSTGPAEVHSWNSSLENLKHCSDRLQDVEIYNECAFGLIPKFDSKSTLFYLDPPYVKTSRISPKVYKHEMNEEDHRKLASVCNNLKGTVILSGYPSDLYEELFGGWKKCYKPTANHSSHKRKKGQVKECLWIKK